MPPPRVALVTGASSGIGKACAGHLALYGYTVYAGSRGSEQFPLDVNSESSVQSAVNTILSREGRLDVLINNAGTALAGAIEDTSQEEALRQFETNFFGTLRMIRAALPHMRRQRGGRIINIGSIGGLIAIPYQGIYSASKFALEGLTESLRLEVSAYGIHAVLIEPGDHRTKLTQNRSSTIQSAGSPYERRFTTAIRRMSKDEQNGPDPVHVARLVQRVLDAGKPRLRYTAGPAIQRAAVFLKRIAPYSVIEKAMNVYYSR